jgi:hypothetical protein
MVTHSQFLFHGTKFVPFQRGGELVHRHSSRRRTRGSVCQNTMTNRRGPRARARRPGRSTRPTPRGRRALADDHR